MVRSGVASRVRIPPLSTDVPQGLEEAFFALALYLFSLSVSCKSTASSLTWFDVLWHCLLPEGVQMFCSFFAISKIFPFLLGR